MEIQIRMVSAASEAINFQRQNPLAIDEESFQHIANYIERQKIRDEKIKMAMIAAAGKAFEMAHKNPEMSDKLLLKEFMQEIPGILVNIDEY